ncbi:hypothetical protein [Luteimonas sp. 3794]|uniref:hypothetical protein n=1 Tax=Luteimonas sp. 3794 TaxID=2817730 RepID=UPI0028628E4C|nr:hypothetical protein [Luteimonas sp. 3794]MDR6990563.1 hypothetical protein [Luteimonas sp. 3794]
MANEFSPLIDVLRELKALVAKKSSGLFFVVTEDNHSCIVRLHGGQIEDVAFRMSRGDEAVQRLSMVTAARARFQVNPASRLGSNPLSEDSLQWLLGGFEQALAQPPRAPVDRGAASPVSNPQAAGGELTAAHHTAIRDVALQHFGPIAGMLCDEAFDPPASLQATLEKLAGNAASPEEGQRFLRDVRAALARLPS